MLGSFHTCYLAGGMRGGAFLPRGFGDAADRRSVVERAARRRVDPALLAELARQDQGLPPDAARRRSLAALAEPGTVVVATGQQVGLFLGPLYSIHKAATAVAIARALSVETGARCVPLFWLQTEDHDFAEIATCFTPREGEPPLRLSLSEEPAQARVSLADRVLGPEVAQRVNTLGAALVGLPHQAEVVSLLREHYRPAVSPGRAFAGVLAALFAEDGLVIFDPRQEVSARLLAPLMRTALGEAGRVDALLQERGRALLEAGLKEQIVPRPGSPLCFFHGDGARGPRFRLAREGDHWRLAGSSQRVSDGELLGALEREPLRFSTSALLRPLAQDTLFPTAVYVGGPAEVDYFAQLTPLYPAFGLEAPLIAHRARLALVPARVRTLLGRLSLSAADLERPEDELLAKLAPPTPGATPEPSWAAELEQRLEGLCHTVDDPGLARVAARMRSSARRSLEKLARRHQRLIVERDEALGGRLERIEAWLFPEGKPQERVFSFPWFAAHAGLEGLHRAIAKSIEAFDPSLREVDL